MGEKDLKLVILLLVREWVWEGYKQKGASGYCVEDKILVENDEQERSLGVWW